MTAAIAADLRQRVACPVVGPDAPDFEARSQGFSLGYRQDVHAVVEVLTAEDVAETIQYAGQQGLVVAAQAAGHSACSTLSGTILIRTTGLKDLSVDAAGPVARVGAGVRWVDLLPALGELGLLGVAGSSGGPSVVGYSLGGGASWFGRRHGFAAHHVTAFEVVTADGELVRVSADENPDLFWALRGGGGDFAVVTAMELVPPRFSELSGGRLMWPMDRAREVFEAFLAVTATAPPELTVWCTALHFPDLPQLPPPLRGARMVAVDATFLGSVAAGRGLLKSVLDVGGPISDSFAELSLANLPAIANEPTEPGYGIPGGFALTDLDMATVDRMLEAIGPSLAGVQIRHLDGAFTQSPLGAGVADAIAEPYLCSIVGIAPTPEARAALAANIAALGVAFGPATAARVPFNLLVEGDPLSRAYPPESVQRLRDVKRAYDPDGVIRSNRPVGTP